MEEKKKLGRPALPDDQKQKYQRVALYPETHAKAKKLAGTEKLIDWFDRLVNAAEEGKKKKFPFFK